MRRWLAPLISMAVFAALLALVLWVPEGEEEVPQAEEEPDLLIDAEVADVERVMIDMGPERLVLVQDPDPSGGDALWRLAEPLEVPVSQSQVRSLVANLVRLKPLRVVAEEAENLAEFGLDEPTGRVSIRMRDGTAHTVLIGDEPPVQEGQSIRHYATLEGTATVVILPSYLTDGLKWEVGDIRRKEVVALEDVDSVRGITVAQAHEVTDLEPAPERPGELPVDWQVVAPFHFPASTDKVMELLRGLRALRVEEFVEDYPADLAPYGLEEPGFKVTLRVETAGGVREKTLLGGNLADSEAQTMYVMTGDEPFVYKIKTGSLAALPLDGFSLARLRPFRDATSQMAMEIAWEIPGSEGRLRRTNREAVFTQSEWNLVSGGRETDFSGDEDLQDLLEKIRSLEGQNLLDLSEHVDPGEYGFEAGPDQPYARVQITVSDRPVGTRLDDPLEEYSATLLVGAPLEGTRSRYLLLEGYGAALVVEDPLVEAILEGLQALPER